MARPPTEPFALAATDAARVNDGFGVTRHDVAVVLGSGWGPAADALGDLLGEVPVTDLAGCPAPTVSGHAGILQSRVAGANRVLVFLGRAHLYEGNGPAEVVHAVRTAVFAGCRVVVLTNAAGSLRPEVGPGTPVLIADHLNLSGASPLAGPVPPPPHDVRFVNLVDLYAARLRALAAEVSPGLAEGVYAMLEGPHYETPAEIRMLRGMGADLVGMSTVLEAIAARHLGAEVLAVSLVTNLAAGLATGGPDHLEVLAAGEAAAADVGLLLRGVIDRL